MNPKLLIGFIALLLLVALGGAYYFVRQQGSGDRGQAPEAVPQEITPIVDVDDILNKDAATPEDKLRATVLEQEEKFGLPSGLSIKVDLVEIADEWGVATVSIIDNQSGEPVGTTGIVLIGHLENGTWRVVRPSDDDYASWVRSVPDSLLSPEDKSFLTQGR